MPLHRWLVDDGHEVFLDQDLRDGIAVGEQWERRLHERLLWADAVVCVVTSTYVTSVWCAAEVATAVSRGSRLLPVRAEAGAAHPLLESVQHVDMTRDDQTHLLQRGPQSKFARSMQGPDWRIDKAKERLLC